MWYAASLLFKSSRTTGKEPPLWEDSIRLISAGSEREAREKAERLGQAEKTTYTVEGGELTWVLDRVERIYEIDATQLADGTEVFSRFLRDSEVASLLTPFEDD